MAKINFMYSEPFDAFINHQVNAYDRNDDLID